MEPAPIPPSGIATWVALSPLKVRCAVFSKRSFDAYEADSRAGTAGAAEASASACTLTADVAAARAAEDPATKNSLRVDFLKKGMESPQKR